VATTGSAATVIRLRAVVTSKPWAKTNPITIDPSSPPMLKAAWKDDMIGLPQARSMATACVFIETSRAPLLMPKTNAAATRNGKLRARPGRSMPRVRAIARRIVALRLVTRADSQLAAGRATTPRRKGKKG
jgi:hypothetical protein